MNIVVFVYMYSTHTCYLVLVKWLEPLFGLKYWYPCSFQLVLVTDGSCGIGEGSLKHSFETLSRRETDTSEDKFPLPFPFPCKLHIACISPPTEPSMKISEPMYQKLIDTNGKGGTIHLPEGSLSLKSVQQMFTKLSAESFSPLRATLWCGNLHSEIQVFPAPEAYNRWGLTLYCLLLFDEVKWSLNLDSCTKLLLQWL